MNLTVATREQLDTIFEAIKSDLKTTLAKNYPDFHFEPKEFLDWVRGLAKSHYDLHMAYVDDYGFLTMCYKLSDSSTLPEYFEMCLPRAEQCGNEMYDPKEWIAASKNDKLLREFWDYRAGTYWAFKWDDGDEPLFGHEHF